MQIKRSRSNKAYIAIGSNLGDREEYLRSALRGIERVVGNIIALSPVYETEPWGETRQNKYLNAVCLVLTDLQPEQLLYGLQALERWMGKKKLTRWGPRTIDLDIIYYGEKIIVEKDLIIPHPNMYLRNFVLTPLMDIAPDMIHPVLKKTTRSLLSECPDQGKLVKIAFQCRS
jgi:2-amino-4-hydroxy-6-hydroxymethyldihydropteridine diphosphokinase